MTGFGRALTSTKVGGVPYVEYRVVTGAHLEGEVGGALLGYHDYGLISILRQVVPGQIDE